MNYRLHKHLIAIGVLYLGIQIGRRFDVFLPTLLNNYLSDILCLPILLGLTLSLLRFLKKDSNVHLDGYKVFFAFVYVSFIFEYWLPKQNPIYTADLIDILCYGIGAITFFTFQKKWFPWSKKTQQINY